MLKLHGLVHVTGCVREHAVALLVLDFQTISGMLFLQSATKGSRCFVLFLFGFSLCAALQPYYIVPLFVRQRRLHQTEHAPGASPMHLLCLCLGVHWSGPRLCSIHPLSVSRSFSAYRHASALPKHRPPLHALTARATCSCSPQPAPGTRQL